MVSFNLTPFSSISTVCLVISTVCVILSKIEKKEVNSPQPLHNVVQQILKQISTRTFCIEQLPIFVQICEKQTVDQGGLSQARFTFKQRTTKKKRPSF